MPIANPYLGGNPFITRRSPGPGRQLAGLGLQLYSLKKKGKPTRTGIKIGESEPGEAMTIPDADMEGLDAFDFGKGGEQITAPGVSAEETGISLFDTESPFLTSAAEESPLLAAEALIPAEEAAGALTAAESAELAGLGASTAEIAPAGAGATLGGVGSAAMSALPYAVIGDALAQGFGELIEKKGGGRTSSSVPAQIGRTMQDTWQGIGRPWVKELFRKQDAENIGKVMDVFNPAGVIFRKMGCIIVTICTAPDSEEVNIAREYRDKFLTKEELRGYYVIAEIAVPLIVHVPGLKWTVKRFLVDNLIAFGKFALRKGPEPGDVARIVTKGFLRLCGVVGKRRTSFIRKNGEEV